MRLLLNSPYDKYRQSSVQTSTPAQLVIMLYDGAIRFIRAGLDGIKKKMIMRKQIPILEKAQTIVSELMSTLDHTYEVSGGLYSLYEYTSFSAYRGEYSQRC
ncbi:flagellar export chaperone FliS [Paenibacillus rhizoplanae]